MPFLNFKPLYQIFTNQNILEVMCGYGRITKVIKETIKPKEITMVDFN